MNVQPNDLAIVSGPTRFTGHVVEVVKVWLGEKIDGIDLGAAEPNMWVCRLARPTSCYGAAMFHGPFPDAWLRPVSGPSCEGITARGARLERHTST